MAIGATTGGSCSRARRSRPAALSDSDRGARTSLRGRQQRHSRLRLLTGSRSGASAVGTAASGITVATRGRRDDRMSRLRNPGRDSAAAAARHGRLHPLPERPREDHRSQHRRGARLLARHTAAARADQRAAASAGRYLRRALAEHHRRGGGAALGPRLDPARGTQRALRHRLAVPALRACSAVLAALRLNRRPSWLGPAFRWSIWLDPWAMVDVYLLAGCIGYFRLINIDQARVTIEPGGACFIAAAFLTMLSRATLDTRTVWRAIGGETHPRSGEPVLGCTTCDLVQPLSREGQRCPRCGARLRAAQARSGRLDRRAPLRRAGPRSSPPTSTR